MAQYDAQYCSDPARHGDMSYGYDVVTLHAAAVQYWYSSHLDRLIRFAR